jgi:hypothetical protein
MLTKKEVLEAIKNGRESKCSFIDGRDYVRLLDFFLLRIGKIWVLKQKKRPGF